MRADAHYNRAAWFVSANGSPMTEQAASTDFRLAEQRELAGRAREAEKRAQTAAQRQRFLAEASRVLAEYLDYRATLRTVARLAVPDGADWSVVALIQDDGS